MTNPLTPFLEKHRHIVLDGALATELERRGADLNDPLWSARVLLEEPEQIRQVHLDYFRAGADCATTASYQATVPGFARRGLSENEALGLIKKSVRLAQDARDEFWSDPDARRGRSFPLVAGSVGPYGAYLADGSEYRGRYGLSEAELVDFHRPRVAALLEAGADLLACETVPGLLEARALVRLLAEFPGAWAWISFSARDGRHTSEGDRLEDCARELDAAPQVAAVGINCTAPRFILEAIHAVRRGTAKPVAAYPNSGETYDPVAKRWLGETDCDAFGATALGWLAAGARLIGGCCRTTPAHIRAFSQLAGALPG